MLSHVRKAKACDLPEGTRSGQLLTDQGLDGRGLPCAVRTNDRHVADLGHGQVHVYNRGLVPRGELKVHARHAQDDLAAALNALEGTGLREGELHRLVAQLEIRILLWVLFHEHGEGVALHSLEGLQLPAREELELVLEPPSTSSRRSSSSRAAQCSPRSPGRPGIRSQQSCSPRPPPFWLLKPGSQDWHIIGSFKCHAYKSLCTKMATDIQNSHAC